MAVGQPKSQGNGRWAGHTRRPWLHECLILPTRVFREAGAFGEGARGRTLKWRVREGAYPRHVMKWETIHGPHGRTIVIRHRPWHARKAPEVEQHLRVVECAVPNGGRRHRLGCPCGRAVDRLILAPNSTEYRCESCVRPGRRSRRRSPRQREAERREARAYGLSVKQLRARQARHKPRGWGR